MKQNATQNEDGSFDIEVKLEQKEATFLDRECTRPVTLRFHIDFPAIIMPLGRKAIWSKHKKATVYHGRISVKAKEG